MAEEFYERVGIPGLLRASRRTYGAAVRAAFADAGFDDLPRNGAYVLARVYDNASALAELIRELGISKQAVSQLIDTMVMRGYLDRTADAGDRRRMLLTLTPRGEAAVRVSSEAASEVDEELVKRLSPEGFAALRSSLTVLAKMAGERDRSAEVAQPALGDGE